MFNFNAKHLQFEQKFADNDGKVYSFSQVGDREECCLSPVGSYYFAVDRDANMLAFIVETCPFPIPGGTKSQNMIAADMLAEKIERLLSPDADVAKKEAVAFVGYKLAENESSDVFNKALESFIRNKEIGGSGHIIAAFAAVNCVNKDKYDSIEKIEQAGGSSAKAAVEFLGRSNDGVKVMVERKEGSTPRICITGSNVALAMEKLQASKLVFRDYDTNALSLNVFKAKKKYMLLPEEFKPLQNSIDATLGVFNKDVNRQNLGPLQSLKRALRGE